MQTKGLCRNRTYFNGIIYKYSHKMEKKKTLPNIRPYIDVVLNEFEQNAYYCSDDTLTLILLLYEFIMMC